MLTALSILAVLGGFAGVPWQAHAPEVIADNRWPGKVLEQVVLVPAESFNQAFLERYFATMTRHEGASFSVVKIVASPDKGVVANNEKPLDIGYSGWRPIFDDYRSAVPPSAQFISINGNASLVFRDKSGRVAEKVIAGSDPRLIRSEGKTLHIADIISKTVRVGSSTDLTTSFYCWSSDPYDNASVAAALKGIIAATGIQRVTVEIEREPWFVLSDFPVLYPYHDLDRPPSEEQYLRMPRTYCSTIFHSTPACSTYGGK